MFGEGFDLQKRLVWISVAFIIAFGILSAGCSQISKKSNANEASKSNSSSSLLRAKWDDVLTEAKGQNVNMYMWGGSDSINKYIDEWVAPRLKNETGVNLKRIPVNDSKDTINKLLADKQAGKKDGSIDIMWINGENFKAAKDNSLLWGSFAGTLPNIQKYVDVNAPDIANDFGLSTDGKEAPWGKAQFVFVYDSNKVRNPPKSMNELLQWAKQNPGKFTYPAPPDFTGSAFIRHVLYEQTGGYEQYTKSIDAKTLEDKAKPAWAYLNQLKPFLWREGKTYPESSTKLDQLFGSGEVWMTMGYDPANASNQIKKGFFSQSTRTFVLEHGTLSNTHYLSIPFNSVHQAGAMAAINLMLSPDAQIAKMDSAIWGEDMSLNPKKLSAEDQKRVAVIDRGEATLPSEVLASHRVPEMLSQYVDVLDKGWASNVAKK
jgi:putative spermidine/putrescine transport system substrate-binding protein